MGLTKDGGGTTFLGVEAFRQQIIISTFHRYSGGEVHGLFVGPVMWIPEMDIYEVMFQGRNQENNVIYVRIFAYNSKVRCTSYTPPHVMCSAVLVYSVCGLWFCKQCLHMLRCILWKSHYVLSINFVPSSAPPFTSLYAVVNGAVHIGTAVGWRPHSANVSTTVDYCTCLGKHIQDSRIVHAGQWILATLVTTLHGLEIVPPMCTTV